MDKLETFLYLLKKENFKIVLIWETQAGQSIVSCNRIMFKNEWVKIIFEELIDDEGFSYYVEGGSKQMDEVVEEISNKLKKCR